MIELKRLNVHRIVDSEEAAARLEAEGFEIVPEEEPPTEITNLPTEEELPTEEFPAAKKVPPAKPVKEK